MRKETIWIGAICALIAGTLAAIGANSTIGVTAGTPGKTANLISFGSGNVISEVGVCDQTTENQCGSVKAASTAAAQTDTASVVRNPDTGTISDSACANSGSSCTEIAIAKGILAATQAGAGTFGATTPASGISVGCNGLNAWPTAVTNGQMAPISCALDGTIINLPYSMKENMVRGTATATNNSATTIIAASGSASLKTYVTGAQCWNESAVSIRVTFNDVETTGSGTILWVPAGSGNNGKFDVPIVTAANTAFQFTASTGETTIGCNAQGYYGP